MNLIAIQCATSGDDFNLTSARPPDAVGLVDQAQHAIRVGQFLRAIEVESAGSAIFIW
jgi:hypothetical protein